jgi:hypothetical protein
MMHQIYKDLLVEYDELIYYIDIRSCDCSCSCCTGNPPCTHCIDHYVDPSVYSYLQNTYDHIQLLEHLYPGIATQCWSVHDKN